MWGMTPIGRIVENPLIIRSLKCLARFGSSFAGFSVRFSGCRLSNFRCQFWPTSFPEISSARAQGSARDHGSPIEAQSAHHLTQVSSCAGVRSCCFTTHPCGSGSLSESKTWVLIGSNLFKHWLNIGFVIWVVTASVSVARKKNGESCRHIWLCLPVKSPTRHSSPCVTEVFFRSCFPRYGTCKDGHDIRI